MCVDSYDCECPNGYTGHMCQVNYDECSSNPCQHGGVCQDKLGYYVCDCPRGFTGEPLLYGALCAKQWFFTIEYVKLVKTQFHSVR